MQTAAPRIKTSRKAFEAKLIAEVGHTNLFAERHQELDAVGDIHNLTLYYRKLARPNRWGMDDVHYATWDGGEGWVFENFDADVEWAI